MKYFLFSCFLFVCVCLHAQINPIPAGAVQFSPDNLVWKEGAAPLPAGTKVALLYGNPKGEGMFAMRLQLPPNFSLPPHFHGSDECVTVLQGNIYVGFGDVFDKQKVNRISKGGYYVNPKGEHHYIFTDKKGVTIQIQSLAPWSVTMCGEHKKE